MDLPRTNNVEWHKGRKDAQNGVSFFDNPYSASDENLDSRFSRWIAGYRSVYPNAKG